MIGLIAVLAGGLIQGLKTPLASPLLYILKSKKDLFLALFFAYCLALGYEFKVHSLYTKPTYIFTLILPTILFLYSMKREVRGTVNYLLVAPILAGILFPPIFAVAVIAAIGYNFYKDKPQLGKGILSSATPISILVVGLIVLKGVLNLPGSASTQAIFIAAAGILTALAFWRETGRTKLIIPK